MLTYLKEFIAELILKIQKTPISVQYNKLIKKGLLEVGRHTYGVPEIDVYKGSERNVTIGSFCSISKGVRLITGGIHQKDWVSLYPFRTTFNLPGAYIDGMPTSNGEIVIGNDVWIGTDAIIMSGVTIGDGAINASGSIVTKSVEPYSIVAGVPAKHIKFRIEEMFIPNMLEIKWWNWEDQKILSEVELLSSKNIDLFVNKFSSEYR